MLKSHGFSVTFLLSYSKKHTIYVLYYKDGTEVLMCPVNKGGNDMYQITEIKRVQVNDDGTTTWSIEDEAHMMVHVKRPSSETLAQVATIAENAGVSIQYLNRSISI